MVGKRGNYPLKIPTRGASHFSIGTCKIGVTVYRGSWSGLKRTAVRRSVVLWEEHQKFITVQGR